MLGRGCVKRVDGLIKESIFDLQALLCCCLRCFLLSGWVINMIVAILVSQVVGAQRRTLAGFSTAAILPHTGFIFYSEIVQMTPEVSEGQELLYIGFVCMMKIQSPFAGILCCCKQ